jgi:hypothetical protein
MPVSLSPPPCTHDGFTNAQLFYVHSEKNPIELLEAMASVFPQMLLDYAMRHHLT